MSFLSIEASEKDLKSRMFAIKNESVMTYSSTAFIEYDKVLNICKKNYWSSCSGYIPHCYIKFGKKRCPAEKVSLDILEYFILPLHRASYKHGINSSINTDYPLSFSLDWYEKSDITLKHLLNKFPRIKKQFNALKSEQYKTRFANYIYMQHTEKERIYLLKEFAEVMSHYNKKLNYFQG